MKGRVSLGSRWRFALQTALGRTRVLSQIFLSAYRRFVGMRAPQAAACMAFYAVFALFPLLLFVVAAGSVTLESEQAREQVVTLVTRLILTSHRLVAENLQ